jgi:beta-lactamase superfamily II metal-dependent hydrolase
MNAVADLQIVIWNVAHGSAMFARTPNNRTILMDAGSSEDFSPAEHLHTRYGMRSTDAFILSHGDCDHLSDLPNVVRLIPPLIFHRNPSTPRHKIFPTDPPPIDPLKTFDAFHRHYCHPVEPQNVLTNPANWGGVSISTYWNTAVNDFDCLNDYSLVTVLDHEGLSFVFPGDIESAGMSVLMTNPSFMAATTPGDRYRVLIAPHHGHTAGVHQPFLDHFKPHLSIISGKWGDPHTDMDAYAAASSGLRARNRATNSATTCQVLTTKRNDSVLIKSDATAVTITV